jgi:hypothetical protein
MIVNASRSKTRDVDLLLPDCVLAGKQDGFLLLRDKQRAASRFTVERLVALFRAVSSLTTAPPISGQGTKLEDALGITAEEAQSLRSIATDCAANIGAIDLAVRPLVQELRFEALAEEPTSESLSQRYDELNRQRARTILDHIQELRGLLKSMA